MKLFFRRVRYCLRLLTQQEKGIAVAGFYSSILQCRIQAKDFDTFWTPWDELKMAWRFTCRKIGKP
ncbi:MAG: hypothetical protein WC455_09920 [Dehalococcoidia bacterium]